MSKIITSFKNGLVKTSLIQVSSNPGFRSILRQSNCPLSNLTSRSTIALSQASGRDGLLRRTFEPNILQTRPIFSQILQLEKIDNLIFHRSAILSRDNEAFIERLQGLVDSDQADSLTDDDIAEFIAITSDESHLDLMEKILEARAASGKALANWGTSMARVYYRMDQLDRACRNLKDPKFGSTFAQANSFLAVMQLAYNHEDYAEVFELHNHACDVLKTESKGPSPSMITLSIAALAKINTPESLAAAEQIFSEFIKDSAVSSIRSISILSYLCLNQGQPNKALDYLTHISNQTLSAVVELKNTVYIELNQFEQLLSHLQFIYARNQGMSGDLAISTKNLQVLISRLPQIEEERVRVLLQDLIEKLVKCRMFHLFDLESHIFRDVTPRPRTLSNSDSSIDPNNPRFVPDKVPQRFGYTDQYNPGRRGGYNNQYDSGKRRGFNDRYNSGGHEKSSNQYTSGRNSWEDPDDTSQTERAI